LKINKILVIISAVIYGFLIALIVNEVPILISLVLAVLVGLIITGKIDYYGHLIGIITFFVTLYFFGFVPFELFDFILLVLFLFVGILDELVSDIFEKKERLIQKILSHRPLLELIAFLVSAYTGVWEIWLTLLLYDIGAGYVPVYKILHKKLI
jgi:hypothetical protein